MFRERHKDTDGRLDYAASLVELVTAGLLDDSLVDGEKSGYAIVITTATEFTFTATAEPVDPGRSGTLYFYVDHSGVVRYSSTGTAGPTDPPYGG